MNVRELSHHMQLLRFVKLQEENISVSHQALTYAKRGMVAVHFLSESQYPGKHRYIYLQTFKIR